MTDAVLPPKVQCLLNTGDNGPGKCWACEEDTQVHLCKFDLYRCAACCQADATREPRVPYTPRKQANKQHDAEEPSWSPLETNPGAIA